MSESGKKSLIKAIVFLVLFVGIGGYIVSANFAAKGMEVDIISSNEVMQNVHSSGQNSLKMQSSALKNYTKSDLAKVNALIKKYEGKPKLLMMAVTENSQGLDPKLHSEFMDAIQKYYTKWERAQNNKIYITQEYRKFLGTSFKGAIAEAMSYPTADVKKIMDTMIISKDTKKTFETGEDEAMELF